MFLLLLLLLLLHVEVLALLGTGQKTPPQES
jgi:hypothetical protein